MESIGDCVNSDDNEVFELAEEFSSKKSSISKSQMNLPHALGSLPHYLSSKPSSALNKSESSLSLGLFEFSDDKMDYLKRQVLHLSGQARESNEKAFKMTKIIDKFRQSSNEMRKELRSCELKLAEKDERIKTLSNQLRLQKDKISQISKYEEKISNLTKMNEGYQNENKSKDEKIEKFVSQINRIKRDIELKEKRYEAKHDEVENWKKKFEKLQQQLKNTEIEVDTKKLQIDLLKMNFIKLEEENSELKLKNTQICESEIIKSLQEKIKNYEIMMMNKFYRLRGEFEMSIFDDVSKKSEISLKVKQIEDLEF